MNITYNIKMISDSVPQNIPFPTLRFDYQGDNYIDVYLTNPDRKITIEKSELIYLLRFLEIA